jgi:hypothetical protein
MGLLLHCTTSRHKIKYNVIKKKKQAMQIIGHVANKEISIQCMGVDNLWSQTLLCNKSYLMKFNRWNYNCAFCYFIII